MNRLSVPIYADLHPTGPAATRSDAPDGPFAPARGPLGEVREGWLAPAFHALLALAAAAGYLLFVSSFVVEAHDGADPNGYLVAARQVLRTGQPHLDVPAAQPYAFIGRMWVLGKAPSDSVVRYVPKYPLGGPLLYAAAMRLSPWGEATAYYVSPAAAALALLAAFFLVRPWAGSWAALLAVLVLAASPITLALAASPDSHALTLLLVTAGMALLLRWYRAGGAITALLAGLLLGAAFAVRYAEGLLLLPILLAAALRTFASGGGDGDGAESPARLRRALESALLIACWALPVLALLDWNLRNLGSPTGYDTTGESLAGAAFTWRHAADHWYVILHQLHDSALPFILPAAVAGLLVMFARNARLALLLAAWVVPALFLHACYYWAPDQEARPATYLRLVLTVVPALALAAAWLAARRTTPTTVVAAGALAALAMLVGTRVGLDLLEADRARRADVAHDVAELRRALASTGRAGPATLLVADRRMGNALQAATDHALLDARLFDARAAQDWISGGRPANGIPGDDAASTPAANAPGSLDPRRRTALRDHLDRRMRQRFGYDPTPEHWLGDAQFFLHEERARLVNSALAGGRRVAYLQLSTRPREVPKDLASWAESNALRARVAATWTTRPGDTAAWQLVEFTHIAPPPPARPAPTTVPVAPKPATTTPAAPKPAATAPAAPTPAAPKPAATTPAAPKPAAPPPAATAPAAPKPATPAPAAPKPAATAPPATAPSPTVPKPPAPPATLPTTRP